MNLWLLFCLLAAFLNAVANHIDKHLVSRYFQGFNIGALVIITSIVGFPISVLIFLIQPQVFAIGFFQVAMLIVGGICISLSFLPYFLALEKDEASRVAPLFQMVSVLTFMLSYFFLGETLTIKQGWGSLIIVIGSLLLTSNLLVGKKFAIKKDVFFLMLLASFFYALNVFIFKFTAVETNFWISAFWEYVGLSLVSFVFLTGVTSFRKQFFKVLHQNSRWVLGLSFSNELLVNVAKLSVHFASLIGPLAVVTLVSEGVQPIFVLVIGVFITLFWPKFGEEDISKAHLLKKAVSILVIVLGSYLVSS